MVHHKVAPEEQKQGEPQGLSSSREVRGGFGIDFLLWASTAAVAAKLPGNASSAALSPGPATQMSSNEFSRERLCGKEGTVEFLSLQQEELFGRGKNNERQMVVMASERMVR